MRSGETGIELDRSLEQRVRRGVVGAVEPVHVLQAHVIGGPGVEGQHAAAVHTGGLMERDPNLECAQDAGADVFAQGMHVGRLAGEALRPHDDAVARVDEFDVDAQAGALQLEGSGQAVARSEQSPDVLDPALGNAATERRTAGDDEQPAQVRQLRDQFLGDGLA